ncbi:hypothetical protein [Spirosoma flavum]|uniref:Serine/threonine protein phosphatase n=1 Tax=Spirosoma flavum TaxID=2048557 RepID=A0ABW6AKH4_9BACT
MRSHRQSVGKEAPAYADNEDAWRAADEAGIWAVADGAGGTGIYAGEWAQHLVQQVPAVPFSGLTDMANWLDGHWEDFFNVHQAQAETDYFIEHKFMNEGSCATLTTLHYRADELHWTVYGDAVALYFHPITDKLGAANPDLRQFESAPYLINWLAPPSPPGFRSGIWPHQPGQQYALLSDTLGQYLLMAYASLHGDAESLRMLAQQPTALGNRAQAHLGYWSDKGGRFGESVWNPFRMALASPETFLPYTQQLRAQNLLGADDYTCILIED